MLREEKSYMKWAKIQYGEDAWNQYDFLAVKQRY